VHIYQGDGGRNALPGLVDHSIVEEGYIEAKRKTSHALARLRFSEGFGPAD
jgi:hypothetical protein